MAEIKPGVEYAGVIIPSTVENYYDPKYRGFYRVHIAELLPRIPEDQGLLCRNRVHKYRMTQSSVGTYGSYYPLHAGTKVIVKFYSTELTSGYIDSIVSDYEENTNWEAQDSNTPIQRPEDRDEQYVVIKTPKKYDIFYINEDTENEPNTLYLVHNRDNNNLKEGPGRRTVYRINDSGIHIWTRDNQRIRIYEDNNKQVSGDQTEYVEGYRTKHIDGDDDQHVHSNKVTKVDKEHHHQTVGNVKIEINGNCEL